MRALWLLVHLEWTLERRNRTAFYSLVFYAALLAFTIGLSFHGPLATLPWAVLYLLAQSFTAITAAGKSFLAEPEGIGMYRYQLALPQHHILAKLVYNTLLLLALHLLLTALFLALVPHPGGVPAGIWLVGVLCALAFAGALTLNAALASTGSQKSMLMAILSFPVQLPVLLTGIAATLKVLDGLDPQRELLTLAAMATGFGIISWLLYPLIAND